MSCLRERISLIGWVIDGWFGCYGMFGMIGIKRLVIKVFGRLRRQDAAIPLFIKRAIKVMQRYNIWRLMSIPN